MSAVEQGAAPLLHLPGRPQLPPLLRGPAGLGHRQLDPGRRRDVADPDPDRERPGGRGDLGAAIPAPAAIRRLGRSARRPLSEALRADGHPGADGAPRAGPVGGDRRRRRRAVDGLRPGLRAGGGQRGRLPDPAELRDRDGGRRSRRQRGQPEQRPDSLRSHPGAGGGRGPDRHGGGRDLLLGQRGLVRRHGGRPEGDGAARASYRARGVPWLRLHSRRASLRPAHARARDPAGDDGPGRNARLQLPGHPAAARPVQLRRRGRRVHRPCGCDGRRVGGRRAGGGCARARWAWPSDGRRVRVRRRRVDRCRRPHPAPRGGRPGPARGRQRHLRRRDQLLAPARRGSSHARAGDGPVLDGLPRLHPNRRADRRLAQPGDRSPGRTRARGRLRSGGGDRRPNRLPAPGPSGTAVPRLRATPVRARAFGWRYGSAVSRSGGGGGG